MFFFAKTHLKITSIISIRRLKPAATLALVLMSVPGQAEERNVIALEISGNQTIATGRILLFVQTRSGQPYSEITIAEDTKRLMDTGFFSTVVPNVETVPEGVKVTFDVKEQPAIKAINFYGNRHYSKKNLQKELKKLHLQVLVIHYLKMLQGLLMNFSDLVRKGKLDKHQNKQPGQELIHQKKIQE